MKLAEFLRTIKRSKFDLGVFVENDKLGRYEWDTKALNECGTTACACGWACTIPSFRKAGLKLEKGFLKYKGAFNFTAASEFFGITLIEAEYLFDPLYYKKADNTTPIEVSNRIKKFVAFPTLILIKIVVYQKRMINLYDLKNR